MQRNTYILPTDNVELTYWGFGHNNRIRHLGVYPHPKFVFIEGLQPSQPSVVMSSTVSLLNHTFTGQAYFSKRLISIGFVHILSP